MNINNYVKVSVKYKYHTKYLNTTVYKISQANNLNWKTEKLKLKEVNIDTISHSKYLFFWIQWTVSIKSISWIVTSLKNYWQKSINLVPSQNFITKYRTAGYIHGCKISRFSGNKVDEKYYFITLIPIKYFSRYYNGCN